jgi:single-strand DNA-binding protein
MLNYVMMMGRLTADPELRTTENGTDFTAFSVAVQRPKQKDKDPETDFFNCIAWRNRAKIVAEWYHKGDMIMFVGTLRNRRYTDKNGNNRYAEQIIIKEIYFTGGKKSGSNEDLPSTPEELSDFTVLSGNDIAEKFEDFDGVPF